MRREKKYFFVVGDDLLLRGKNSFKICFIFHSQKKAEEFDFLKTTSLSCAHDG